METGVWLPISSQNICNGQAFAGCKHCVLLIAQAKGVFLSARVRLWRPGVREKASDSAVVDPGHWQSEWCSGCSKPARSTGSLHHTCRHSNRITPDTEICRECAQRGNSNVLFAAQVCAYAIKCIKAPANLILPNVSIEASSQLVHSLTARPTSPYSSSKKGFHSTTFHTEAVI